MANEKNLPLPSALILDEQSNLTLAELCRACSVRAEFIVELVDEGVLAPQGREPHRWRFSGVHLYRTRVAFHLQRDLGINLAGAALVLQLLEEVDALRARLRIIGGE
ncbi:chaperone modulator CbpM [Dechloromonas hortensis]|uniref:chaperone modulator CbpM n=1 Tax=Dechloromonas hortensis TaxID=337779 RepID=UPI001292955D|nr:chaperone modulator CbpM [Dechloromonas hortensis]